MNEFRGYFRSVAASSLGNTLASAVAAGLLLPLVIRRAGLDAYGQWAVLGLFVGVASLLDIGVLKAVVYLVARGQTKAGRVTGSALAISSAAAGVFAAFLLVLVAAGVPLFGTVSRLHPEVVPWLCVTGTCIVAASLYTNVLRGVLEARLRGDLVNVGFALLTLLQYGGLALLACVGLEVRWLLCSSAGIYVAVAVFHHAQLRLLGEWPAPAVDGAAIRAIAAYGWKSYLAEVPVNLLSPLVLYLFVQSADGSGQYGVMDLAVRICTLASSALGALSVPFLAIAASEGAQHAGRAHSLALRFLRITVSLALAGWAVFWVAGEYVVRLVFGANSHSIWTASLGMLGGAALVAAMEPLARWLLGAGHVGRLASARYAMLAVTALAIPVLRPMAAIERFPLAVSIGYAVCAAWLVLAFVSAPTVPSPDTAR